MRSFDVQSVSIHKPAMAVFDYIANPANLQNWTRAFSRADDASADLVTPNGSVTIKLETLANNASGTIDWKMTFPDNRVGWAYSRVTPEDADKTIYAFVLMVPPVPLEMLEGALAEQMKTLAQELVDLKRKLEG